MLFIIGIRKLSVHADCSCDRRRKKGNYQLTECSQILRPSQPASYQSLHGQWRSPAVPSSPWPPPARGQPQPLRGQPGVPPSRARASCGTSPPRECCVRRRSAAR